MSQIKCKSCGRAVCGLIEVFGQTLCADCINKVFADHEQALAAKEAAERRRGRKEEVEPLWQAFGDVFTVAHKLSQVSSATGEVQNAIDAVLFAVDRMMKVRADVGKIQKALP